MQAVKGKIVKILTEKALVIDLGLKDGIQLNDTVHVISEGEEITDPDSGKAIENLQYIKGILHISHIQDSIATCAPMSAPKSEESSLYRTVSSDMARVAMENSPYGENASPLKVKSSDISGMPGIDPIAINDVVVVFTDNG
jgi:hypothetical protein